MQQIIYISIILILLFLIAELYRWNVLYKKINKMISKQNEDFVETHAKLSREFGEQFKKFHEESIENTRRIEDYTKIYSGWSDLYEKMNLNINREIEQWKQERA